MCLSTQGWDPSVGRSRGTHKPSPTCSQQNIESPIFIDKIYFSMFPIYPTEPIPQHRAIPSIVARYPNDGTHELSEGGAHGTQTYIIHICILFITPAAGKI